MNAVTLLQRLADLGVALHADGDSLRVSAPKGVLGPELQAAIAANKPDLLSLIKQSAQDRAYAAVQQVPRDDWLPLSISQERMWDLSQMVDDSSNFNMYLAFRLDGALHIDSLEAALQQLIQRHEPLRTTFGVLADGQPVQRIHSDVDWSLDVTMLEATADSEQQVGRFIHKSAAYPFDLAKEILFRARLLRLAADSHILTISMHHLISDGWSWDILLRDLAALYAAHCSGKSPGLPDLPLQYVDYAAWQRAFVSSAAYQRQLDYWRASLESVQALKLPTSYPRQGKLDFIGSRAELELSPVLMAQLRALATAQDATPFMVFLAGFAASLYQITGQDDLLICSPVAGRGPVQDSPILGYFNNILPLRIGLRAQASFRDLVSQVRDVALRAYEHPDVPLHCLTQLPGLASLSFGRVAFALQDSMGYHLTLDGLTVRGMPVYNQTANFDLFVSVVQRDDLHHLVAEYRSSLFEAELVEQILRDLASLLESCLAAPADSLGSMSPQVNQSPVRSRAGHKARTSDQLPGGAYELRLFKLWSSILGHEDFGVHDNFFELGASSLQAITLISRMRQAFDRPIPMALLFQAATISALARWLSKDAPQRAWSSLVPIKPTGSRPPFFLVHHGGGGLFGYADLARKLAADQPLYGLQEMGIEDGQKLPTSVEQLAQLYVEEIQTVQAQGPYYVGGFCFGGLVAFEIAQQLQRKGEKVGLLVLLDAAPSGATPSGTSHQRIEKHKDRLARLSPSGKVAYMFGRIRRGLVRESKQLYGRLRRLMEHAIFDILDSLNQPVPSYLRQRRLLQINGHLGDRYQPQAFEGNALLIRGSYPELFYASDFGWNTLIHPDIQICQLSSNDHLEMLAYPHLDKLSQHLQTALAAGVDGSETQKERILDHDCVK